MTTYINDRRDLNGDASKYLTGEIELVLFDPSYPGFSAPTITLQTEVDSKTGKKMLKSGQIKAYLQAAFVDNKNTGF